MLKFLIVAALLVTFTSNVAAGVIAQSSWSGGYDTISRVYAHNTGFAVIMKNHQFVANNGCDSGHHFVVQTTDPNYEMKAKTLLSAYYAGHQIIINWTGDNGCQAFINRFQVKP
jgi:hypothetical protein